MELNPRFRFETFVVGPSNRLAATAAQAVSGNPGLVYNPLFVYGRSGLGKTHLLHAIGFGALERQPALRVAYVTLEEFVEQYHAAVAAGHADAFRAGAVETDVLLLDDLQFLATHREMQAELLRLTEAMQAAGHQLVCTCDRVLAEVGELDERLISRLSGGLMVDLGPPDFETRLIILRRKAEERGTAFADGVLEAAAEMAVTSVRALIGLANRLIAFQSVSEKPLTVAAARGLLAELGEPEPAVSPGPPDRPAAEAGQAPPAVPDEFAAFVSAVTRTVAQSLDSWRSRIGEAVMRWSGEGYRTARLEALLHRETLPELEEVLARFAADVETLRALAAEAEKIDPAAAGHPLFRDPDGLDHASEFVSRLREGAVPPPAPATGLTFDGYVVGSANEAAVRVSRLVAEEPGRRYNPLFLTGPSGVGKTHLLNAVGNAIARSGGRPAVACLSAQAFVEDLLAASQSSHVDWWRRRYRRADALLLDDVQLLSGKEQTQEELFNLLNVMLDAERQLVFAADRAPAALAGIEPRLITRFEGGLVMELAPPDRAMRETMVRRLLAVRRIGADDDVVQYIAARPADSARAVHGLVNRALSAMEQADTELSLAVAQLAIEGRSMRPSQARAVSAPLPAGMDPLLAGREKLLWDWPEVADRLVEELR